MPNTNNSDGAIGGCAIIAGILLASPFIIAACPVLLGIIAGLLVLGAWVLLIKWLIKIFGG